MTADDKGEDELVGPLADRSCTDVVFLCLFAAFVAGMGVISYMAYDQGNVALLIRGYDSYGNVCDQENDPIPGIEYSGLNMKSKKNLLYLNPDDLRTSNFVKTVCVETCPNKTYARVKDIPVVFCLPGAKQGDRKLCPEAPLYKSSPVVHRCIPDEASDGAQKISQQAEKITDLIGEDALENFAAEVKRSWKQIVYIILVGIGCSLMILVLMRFLAAVFVYTVYLLVIFGSVAGTTVLWLKYTDEKEKLDNTPEERKTNEDEDNVTAFLYYSIASTVVTAVLLLVMLFMWSRVKLVVALFKEAGAVVITMPFLVIQPFFTLLSVGLFLIYWGATVLFIASCKDPVVKNTKDGDFVHYETDEFMKKAFWYHLFGLFWVTQFLVACQLMIIAGAVAAWYFTRDKSKLGWFPILSSLHRTVRYHLGTLALGSLIIAVVQFIKAVLSYIQAKLGGSENLVAKIIFKCMFCFLWCLENFLKFINRNAYIMTAIYGYSFCTAAKRGFELLLANAMRVVAINTVGDFCLFLAKILVVIVVVVVGIKITEGNDEIEVDAIPIAIGAIVTYVIATVFLSVYEMVVDTIFLCFCEDSNRNDGSAGKPYYMSENLKEFVDTTNEALRLRKEKKEEKQKLVEKSDSN